jgi:hypothetical protein
VSFDNDTALLTVTKLPKTNASGKPEGLQRASRNGWE